MGVLWLPERLTTWGRSRFANVAASSPDSCDVAAQAVSGADGTKGFRGVIAYGAGRCYGDAALNDRGRTILTGALNRILSFSPVTREVVLEAGVTFAQLARRFHALKFTFAVSSATGAVTLGGAVANDIHSKNHHSMGGFARSVRWIDVLLADGSVVRANRDTEQNLFRATVGGMGLTGIILRVCLELIPVRSGSVVANYRPMPGIDAFLDAADNAIDTGRPTFWFGWIDALARGASMGRGILETGEYAASDDDAVPMPREFCFRFSLPRIVLHPTIIARYNEHRFRRVPAVGTMMKQSLEQFCFPLDYLVNFNKVYGRGGFYSFHCGIPQGNHGGVRELLRTISAARAGSMAAVLKPMGGPGEGLMSFPLKGYALAVDTPRRSGTEALYAQLERMVLQHGGRIYVAKDALMSAQGYHRMFPELENFRTVLRQVDPGGKFQSDMSRRLGIRPELTAA